jgi:hypothetical protein
MADVPHAYPPDMPAPRRAVVKKLIAALGLVVSNVNAFTLFAQGDTYHPTWIEDDEKKRKLRVIHTLACIELAKDFGAPTMSLQPGGPTIGTSITREVAGERFAEGLAQVLPVAQEHGLVLAIEPEPGLFIETAREYLEFKNRFFADEPLIRMNCDVGHFVLRWRGSRGGDTGDARADRRMCTWRTSGKTACISISRRGRARSISHRFSRRWSDRLHRLGHRRAVPLRDDGGGRGEAGA